MDASDVLSAQNALCSHLINVFPKSWKCAFVNFEFQDHPSTLVSSQVAFVVEKRFFSRPRRVDLFLKGKEIDLFNTLCLALLSGKAERFLTIDLILFRAPNKFKIYIDYGPPERLSGNLVYSSRHERYLACAPLLSTPRTESA